MTPVPRYLLRIFLGAGGTKLFELVRDRRDRRADWLALAAGILGCNTILLILMTRAGLNAYAAKVLTEMLLFVISYLVQKKVVFQKQQKAKYFWNLM
jgi:uncharacterized membrane protein SirB2